MAIDTAEKRYSMVAIAKPGGLPLLPVPSGTVTAAERAHFEGLYSGISLNPPVQGTGIPYLMLLGVGS